MDGSGARASRASSVAAAACDGPHATPARLGATLRLRSATVALQRTALQRTAASGDRGYRESLHRSPQVATSLLIHLIHLIHFSFTRHVTCGMRDVCR